ncbi:MAG: F0F1 ATP synthase subunit delta [Candidatus Omnitrophica bacterium]|nr:F0F1 ATP synthase subunit delta [Candidatus Omnitrophota bacterium]
MLIIGFILAQVLLLVIIVLVLKRMIFTDTDSAINRLAKLNQINRQKEKILADKIEQAQQFIENEKKKIRETEGKLKLESKRAVQQLHADAVKKAKEESEEIIKKALESKQQMKMEASLDAQSKVLEFCSGIIGEVLGPVILKQLNDQLAADFIAQLEKADWSKINTEGSEIEVVSSREIDPGILEKLRLALSAKINKDLRVVSKVDETVIGGIRMTIGTTIVDGTVAEKISDMVNLKKEELENKLA